MRVLATGVTGYIGQHLSAAVKSFDLDFIGAVRGSILSRKQNLVSIPDLARLAVTEPNLAGSDVIVHLANLAAAPKTKNLNQAREELNAVNVKGTENLLRCAAHNNVKRFIYISSLKAIGERTNQNSPLSNTSTPQPEDPYGESKLAAEQLIQQLAPELGIEYVIIRPPMVYGPGSTANFGSLVNLVKKQWPLPFKSINNRRSMVYVGNLVDLIIQCLDHPKAANQVFMVSDNHDPSLPELIHAIATESQLKDPCFKFPVSLLNLMGSLTGKRDLIDKLTGDLIVDISHTQHTLNWQPPFTFSQGINLSVANHEHEPLLSTD